MGMGFIIGVLVAGYLNNEAMIALAAVCFVSALLEAWGLARK